MTRFPLRMLGLCFCVLVLAACDNRKCLRYESRAVTTYTSTCPSYLKYCASGTPSTTYHQVCVEYEQPNRRIENANYRKLERERAAAKAKAAHDKYWTPERLKRSRERFNSPAAKQKRAAAARKEAARKRKLKKTQRAATQKAFARWNREHRLALRDNRAALQKYPEIAWLSGIWCYGTPKRRFHRYEILDNGRLRKVSFKGAHESSYARESKKFYAVRQRDGLFMLTPIYAANVKDPYKLSYGKTYSEEAIRKDSGNQLTHEWTRLVYPYRSIFKRGGPGRKSKRNYKYQRCEIG